MRILWLSNPPWLASGYGEQTALALPRLVEQGHDVAVLCNWGLNGQATHWNDIACFPSDGQWGNQSVGWFAEQYQADVVIALCDAWVLKPDMWPDELRMAVWAPVDHQPAPPDVVKALIHPRVAPIAMSLFGRRMMEDAGLEPLYVPHMVDTNVFRPQPDLRDAVRDELRIPHDAFLVGMVAANVGNPAIPRKAWPQAFHAFARFAERHKDAWLYAHTQLKPGQGGGLHLDVLAAATGCPEGRIWFPPMESWHTPMAPDALAYLYQAFDVLLMPSMGEGFGIPLLEAQACGVPVITSDHSAMVEMCGSGWLVDGDPWWDAMQSSFFHMPHIDAIVGALEASYRARAHSPLRERAVEFAAAYDADTVTDTYWASALDRLGAPLEAVA